MKILKQWWLQQRVVQLLACGHIIHYTASTCIGCEQGIPGFTINRELGRVVHWKPLMCSVYPGKGYDTGLKPIEKEDQDQSKVSCLRCIRRIVAQGIVI